MRNLARWVVVVNLAGKRGQPWREYRSWPPFGLVLDAKLGLIGSECEWDRARMCIAASRECEHIFTCLVRCGAHYFMAYDVSAFTELETFKRLPE